MQHYLLTQKNNTNHVNPINMGMQHNIPMRNNFDSFNPAIQNYNHSSGTNSNNPSKKIEL
jgi:hypothetical protein